MNVKMFLRSLYLMIFLSVCISAFSQIPQNMTRFRYKTKYDIMVKDTVIIHDNVDLSMNHDSCDLYYNLSFKGYLNFIIEILIRNYDTIGVVTSYTYEVEKPKPNENDKLYFTNLWKFEKETLKLVYRRKNLDTLFIRQACMILDKTNFKMKQSKVNEGLARICESPYSYLLIRKKNSEIDRLYINKACIPYYPKDDNAELIVNFLDNYKEGRSFLDEGFPSKKIYLSELRNSAYFYIGRKYKKSKLDD